MAGSHFLKIDLNFEHFHLKIWFLAAKWLLNARIPYFLKVREKKSLFNKPSNIVSNISFSGHTKTKNGKIRADGSLRKQLSIQMHVFAAFLITYLTYKTIY